MDGGRECHRITVHALVCGGVDVSRAVRAELAAACAGHAAAPEGGAAVR
ncbi:hypothetical protein [Xanthomonas fragariae]|nr:hypothetical protein [Xanthomonas fragariae]MDM7554934.1 hypothetical protein [Xanthomonas fragariae]MDM7558045.1 hypothetical protein [Xanthomonas fragariae]MDM7575730.1 hypothetical protein [Xanthomonas fragariae]MDM7578799.1 hypothetical protein [Xanthomonas fragariae]MDM7589032.1 hypothetical protein [Xanthomonas fragariae]